MIQNRKGISPLIATVLLIGFTIVLAALVFQWGGQLFKSTTTQTGCQSEGRIACTSTVSLALGAVNFSSSNSSITKLIVSNSVSSNSITTLSVQVESKDGSIVTKTVDLTNNPITPGSSVDVANVLGVSLGFAGSTSDTIKGIHVIPGFVQTSSDGTTCKITCSEQTVTALNDGSGAINFNP